MLTNANLFKLAHHAIWDYVISRGLLALLAGILLISMPGAATLLVCLIIAFFLIVNGVMALMKTVNATANRNSLLAYGLICLAAGIVILLNPLLLGKLFVWVFAIWVLISGVNQCTSAVKDKAGLTSARILTGITGLLSVILGLALMINADLGLKVIVTVIGVYFLAFGLLAIMIGIVLHRANKHRHEAFSE